MFYHKLVMNYDGCGDLCNCFELSHQNPMKAFDLFFVNITFIVSSANLRLVPRNIIAKSDIS